MSPVAGSSNAGASFDYTEGASALDIDKAVANNRRSRRDSQYSAVYGEDGEGAMFSGPGHSVNPSSISRMSHIDLGRRSSEDWTRSRRKSHDSGVVGRRSLDRRSSKDSQVSQQSDPEHPNGAVEDDQSDGSISGDGQSRRSGRRRRRMRTPTPPPRPSVFGGLASLFARTETVDSPTTRRPSISQRSSTGSIGRHSRRSGRSHAGSDYALETDDEGEERWGYSSGEEESSDEESTHSLDSMSMNDNMSVTASMQYGSEPSSPQMSQSLPLLSSDQVFGGESRIDMETPFALMEPPPPGPPSRQTIYIPDEDSTIRFIGYEIIIWRQWAWRMGCVLSVGILGLIGHWFPRLWLHWVAHEKAFKDAHQGFVVVEVRFPIFIQLGCVDELPSPPTEISLYFPSTLLIIHIISRPFSAFLWTPIRIQRIRPNLTKITMNGTECSAACPLSITDILGSLWTQELGCLT